MKILSIGDNCIDAYVDQRVGYPGGGCVNVAVHTARLGGSSAYIGSFGKDKLAQHILDSLKKEKVDIEQIQVYQGSTAIAFVTHVENDRLFLGSDRGVRSLLKPGLLKKEYLVNFDLIHTTLDGKVDDHIAFWSSLGCKISYDFSNRFLPEQLDLLPYIDYAFFSGGDTKSEILEEKSKEYFTRGSKLIVFTRGDKGSMAFDGYKFYYQEAIETKNHDSLGSGDVYISSFLVSFLLGSDIKKAMEAGSIEAAKSLMFYGGFGRGKKFDELDIDVSRYSMYKKPRK